MKSQYDFNVKNKTNKYSIILLGSQYSSHLIDLKHYLVAQQQPVILILSLCSAIQYLDKIRHPILLLVDDLHPVCNVFEVFIHLRHNSHFTLAHSILLTPQQQPDYLYQAFMAGYDDYIAIPYNVQHAYLRIMTHLYRQQQQLQYYDIQQYCPQLTPRETEVMHWLMRGQSNKNIANRLCCSPRTINKHLEHIFRKLSVATRTAAVAYINQYHWRKKNPQLLFEDFDQQQQV
ncbi:hypothetical protein BFG52_00060 [Acinetobacter larvae]|uniref:HTH luxR-type domain-containing protein n=1 Tax=Acinetobacter larvae TaxID=1789224 RepID=A0A1B2LVF5_9GAMM|nr:hypothetical protein BFG52_00060 [Acinetobacter larvae]